MFEGFSGPARFSVVRAQTEAGRLGHRHIGTEHLLLAILAEPNGATSGALAEIGVTATSVEAEVLRRVGFGTVPLDSHIPFTDRARSAIQQSRREARLLEHALVRPGHILLAILRDASCLAAEILSGAGVTLERARELVVAQPDEGDAPTRPADPFIPPPETALAAARTVQIRVDGDGVHIRMSDAHTIEQGTRIVDLAGGTVTPDTADAVTLMEVSTLFLQGLARLEARLDARRTRFGPS